MSAIGREVALAVSKAFLAEMKADGNPRPVIAAADAAIQPLVEMLEVLEAAASRALEAIDAYNTDNGTFLCGGALMGLAKATHPARDILARAGVQS